MFPNKPETSEEKELKDNNAKKEQEKNILFADTTTVTNRMQAEILKSEKKLPELHVDNLEDLKVQVRDKTNKHPIVFKDK